MEESEETRETLLSCAKLNMSHDIVVVDALTCRVIAWFPNQQTCASAAHITFQPTCCLSNVLGLGLTEYCM